MKARMLVLGAAVAALGALATAAVALDAIDIPSLVDEETADHGAVPLEPLVPTEDPDDPLEPLIPAGSDLAEAYRVEVRQTYTAAHDAPIGSDTQEGEEWYAGDLVRVADDRYEGRMIAIASLDQTATGIMGDTCHISWIGRQVVETVGVVRTAESLPPYMIEGDDAGGVYFPIYLTEPIGTADWSDPDDDCGGVASEWLPLSYTGPELQGSALGGAVPRLPPPGYGKVEERFDYDGPGILGPTTYEWVFTLTPISASDVRDVEDVTDAIEIPPLVED